MLVKCHYPASAYPLAAANSQQVTYFGVSKASVPAGTIQVGKVALDKWVCLSN